MGLPLSAHRQGLAPGGGDGSVDNGGLGVAVDLDETSQPEDVHAVLVVGGRAVPDQSVRFGPGGSGGVAMLSSVSVGTGVELLDGGGLSDGLPGRSSACTQAVLTHSLFSVDPRLERDFKALVLEPARLVEVNSRWLQS